MNRRADSSTVAAEPAPRHWLDRIWNRSRIRQNILMFLLMLLFGFIVMNHVMSVRADAVSSNLLIRYKQRQADLVKYQDRYDALIAENNELNQRKAKSMADLLVERGLDSLQAELQQVRVLAGFSVAKGKGITLVLDDKPNYSILADTSQSIVHDSDLRRAINLLNAAGAAAISINGLRYTNASNILCIGSTIRCNNERLIPPYEIVALGDPDKLAAAIANDQEFNIRQSAGIDLVVKVQKSSAIVIPAFAEADDIDQFIDMLEVVK